MPTEYPQIFVSWSSPDRPVVEPFINRLKSCGLNVQEYSEGMVGGEPIAITVRQWIRQSKIAVVFYSDDTVAREWVTSEIAWCVQALEDRTLKKIIGVHVGEQSHPQKIPLMLRAENLNVVHLDVPATPLLGPESAAFKLAGTVAHHSGMEVQILPAALFAMTKARAGELLSMAGLIVENVRFEDYWQNLCANLGMGNPPKLLHRLTERYGDTPEQLRPFENGPTIMSIVDERLRAVNKKRREERRPPLFIRWIHDDLRSPNDQVADEAEALWRTSESLLIIDSLSTWAPEIRSTIEQRITDFGRSSLLWLPPYTQQIGSLDGALDDALRLVRRVRTEFRTDEDPNRDDDDPSRAMVRDAMNQSAMSRWLHRVLRGVASQRPSGLAVNEMKQATDSSITPADMFH